jgi:carboxyl-terminal processing protease
VQRQTSRLVIATAAVAVVAFAAGAMVDRLVQVKRDPPRDPPAAVAGPDLSLVSQAWDIISREYVDRSAIQPKAMTNGAISGMVDALGDTGHSAFLTPQMLEEERSLMRGRYVGVGLEIQTKNDQVVIVSALDDSPAAQAGLRAGEQILKVNGASTAGIGLAQVVNLITGPAGTTVTLTLFDPAAKAAFDVTLRRTDIHVKNVSWLQVPDGAVADIRISTFSGGVARDLETVLGAVAERKLKGAVLDLRNNPGGELEEAIRVASQFLSQGDVLLEKDSRGTIQHDKVQPGGLARTLPLVVLVNDGTASAAEIVAGALQDARRARVVGTATFGTGTVLSSFPLSDGSSLLLAVREWLTPSGRTIWHKGIVPDIPLALPADVELLTPSALKGMSRQLVAASRDLQIRKAIAMLEQGS